jgi:putative membrane protein
MSHPVIAYCGPAPLPAEVWTRWNLDPLLIAPLVLFILAIALGRPAAHPRAVVAAIALMFVLFISPFCALSSALFSARVLHHVILVSAVAPLLAIAFPAQRHPVPLAPLVVIHAVLLWLWHTPGAYAWGLATVPAYWLMQVSLLASAWLMWRAVLSPASQPGAALIALAATIGQMGLLGALIVFAPRPLYAVHFDSTWPWGLSPLMDQQLAGLLMWVPAMLPYLGAGLWLAWTNLRPAEAR